MTPIKPRTPTPELSVDTLGGERWSLSESRPKNLSMIVVYRGLHCPICKPYIRDLDRNLTEFDKLGVDAITMSSDSRERAEAAKDEWELQNVRIGYGLSIATAREWGLYISAGRGKTSIGIVEPDEFVEPGLFLVQPDKTLYASSINTMPFARPHFKELLGAIDFIVSKDYPARGEA